MHWGGLTITGSEEWLPTWYDSRGHILVIIALSIGVLKTSELSLETQIHLG